MMRMMIVMAREACFLIDWVRQDLWGVGMILLASEAWFLVDGMSWALWGVDNDTTAYFHFLVHVLSRTFTLYVV